MHVPLGDYHVITGPSVLLWGLAYCFELAEAAPAAKSEGCQPNHFGLGLGLGYDLGRM